MASLKGLFPGPFAGPETKALYEVSLGRFLVAFNAIENAARATIRIILKKLEREDLWPALEKEMFLRQVTHLRLLALSIKDFPELPYSEMIKINSRRNELAHGHFDQDLFSDEFRILGRGKSTEVTIEDVNAETERAWEIVGQLEGSWPELWFDEIEDDA